VRVVTTSFTKGLTDIGNGVYAYLQPNGSWGWSNAGLITSGSSSLLVDTLYTLDLTQEMLDTMRAGVPAARSIDILVNSHADGDHTYGNQLVRGAQIIATAAAAADMAVDITAEQLRNVLANTDAMGVGGRFLRKVMAPFDFSGIELVLPTETFTGHKTLRVGDKTVELIDLGPAHSRGDLIVLVPEDRVVFVADLLFIGGHAPVWAGPISNWTRACDAILALDVDVIVPGHGPVSDKAGLRAFRDYLDYVETEATRMYERGLDVMQAARAIDLSAYAHWTDAERIAVAVDSTYRMLSGSTEPRDRIALFTKMGELDEEAREA
jgi:glyoxylase-like metal-dependent hydrolase (beta-lactamase superfamily II)